MQKILPASFGQRLMAFLIDASVLVFLSFILSIVIIWAASSFFNIYGLLGYGVQFIVPVAFISFFYYLPETNVHGKSLGKAVIGLEIRSSDNQNAGELLLWVRYFLKQIPAFMIFASYLFDHPLYHVLTILVIIVYLFAFLAISSKQQQSWYDWLSACSVYPSKTKAFKSINLGKNQRKNASQQQKSVAIRQSQLADHPNQLQYPCAIELKLFCTEQEGLQDKLFELFNEHQAIGHENHLQFKGKKGSYHIFKALARFEKAEQMEDTYQALRASKNVVMLLPKKAFKLRAVS